MATKSKAAPKAATKKPANNAAPKAPAKKAEPVVVESLSVSAAQDGATLVINGVPHRLSVQQLLDVRRQFNDQAAGLVH